MSMGKLKIFFPIIILLIFLTGCSDSASAKVKVSVGENSAIVKRDKFTDSKCVEITVPKWISAEISKAEKSGLSRSSASLKKHTVNEDETVTYSINPAAKPNLMADIKKFAVDSVNSQTDKFKEISQIKINDAFDHITLMVKKSDFKKDRLAKIPENIYGPLSIYRCLNSCGDKPEDYLLSMTVIDPNSYETVAEITYPAETPEAPPATPAA